MKRLLFACLLLAVPAMAQDGAAYGPMLEGYEYPFPLQHYRFQSQDVAMDMAYMDVKPATPNGHTIVLLHGKNFCSATWEGSIRALSGAGFRVIAPDQVGWCKSTKPQLYEYTFEQLAANTHELLKSLGITRAIVMGHSTGGMMAMRYGLTFPSDTERLVLVDPLGLED
ncbi:MAG: alpha/beta hydrolase, partial [Alphaproteobacteria bacterium]|nr:alpha/beta hydrolase [Alphaproteobacteria bacterium]